MCGRFSRARMGLTYVEPLITDDRDPRGSVSPDLFRPSWNISPGTKQPVLKPDGVHLEGWGFRPLWAVRRGVPMMINARLDKAQTSTWKRLFASGRRVVPADGWYEWVAERGRKQPYYIVPNDGAPLFFAGLSSVANDKATEPTAGTVDGFVIVTDAAAGGMLDVHDRRPLVLSPQEAQAWLDPDTTFEGATHIANNGRTRPDDFHWFRVTPEVNRSGAGNDRAEFNEPIEPPGDPDDHGN